MPELPEVESTRRGIERALSGQSVRELRVYDHRLRWPVDERIAPQLAGQAVLGVGRRAKYLLLRLERGTLILHLGMSGNLRVLPAATPRLKHDQFDLLISSGLAVRFNDPRRFGSMKLVARAKLDTEPLLQSLGPEPLGNAFDAAMLAHACQGKKTSLKAALLDQRVVAGLGNIYVCEALHRALLSPKRMASTIADRKGEPNERAVRLVDSIKAVLNDAIKSGGSSLRDHRLTDGDLGMFQHNFRVYDREGERCRTPGCPGMVKRIVQNGRSTFYCPTCQK